MNGRRRDFVKSDACMVGQKMSDAYGEKKKFFLRGYMLWCWLVVVVMKMKEDC